MVVIFISLEEIFKVYGFWIFLMSILIFVLIVMGIYYLCKYIARKKQPMDTFYIGVDAYGKRYNVASTEEWFFKHLSDSQISDILAHIDYVNEWKKKKLLECKNEKQIYKFNASFNSFSQKVFYCEIYRSRTMYTQKDYVKTPYIGQITYFGENYSINRIRNALIKYGRIKK